MELATFSVRFPTISHGDPIARAFELARGGTCRNVSDIRRALEREGYSVAGHFEGPSFKKQLNALIKAAQ